MLKTALRHFPLVLVIIVSLAFVGFALAQELSVDARANASARIPLKPIDLIRAAKENTEGAGVQAHAHAEANLRDSNASTSDHRPGTGLKALVRIHAGFVRERLALAQRQFEKLAARIQSRLDKLAATGVTTTDAQADLDAAVAADAQAKADVQAVADYIAGVSDASDRAAVKTELKAKIETARASLRAAHAALGTAVQALVALVKTSAPDAGVSAAGTVETNSNIDAGANE